MSEELMELESLDPMLAENSQVGFVRGRMNGRACHKYVMGTNVVVL